MESQPQVCTGGVLHQLLRPDVLLEGPVGLVPSLRLTAPAPNPISSAATLRFGAKKAQRVEVDLYDVLGRQVRTLYQGRPEAGQMQRARLRATACRQGRISCV